MSEEWRNQPHTPIRSATPGVQQQSACPKPGFARLPVWNATLSWDWQRETLPFPETHSGELCPFLRIDDKRLPLFLCEAEVIQEHPTQCQGGRQWTPSLDGLYVHTDTYGNILSGHYWIIFPHQTSALPRIPTLLFLGHFWVPRIILDSLVHWDFLGDHVYLRPCQFRLCNCPSPLKLVSSPGRSQRLLGFRFSSQSQVQRAGTMLIH